MTPLLLYPMVTRVLKLESDWSENKIFRVTSKHPKSINSRESPGDFSTSLMAVYRRRRNAHFGLFNTAKYATAAALAFKQSRSYTKTKSSKKQRSLPGVSNQHDMQTVYRRRRMPRYKKKRWVGFCKKVRAVLLKEHGSLNIIRNSEISTTCNNPSQDQEFQFHLIYGCQGDALASKSAGHDDLTKVAGSAATNNTSLLKFKSAILDITMTNKATVGQEVDIYHIQFW